MYAFNHRGCNPHEDIGHFFSRLKWQSSTGELEEVKNLLINSTLFTFDAPLSDRIRYGLFDYMEHLNIAEDRSIIKIAIWLHQHNVAFDIRFYYNTSLPVLYNLSRVKWPSRLKKSLLDDMDSVMSFDLALSD